MQMIYIKAWTSWGTACVHFRHDTGYWLEAFSSGEGETVKLSQHDKVHSRYIWEKSTNLISLLPTEANTVLDGEFVGGLTGAGESGRVTTVFEAAQVSRHCEETRGGWKKTQWHIQSISHAHLHVYDEWFFFVLSFRFSHHGIPS